MEDKGLLDHNKNATAEKEKQDEKEKNAADESTEIEDKSLLCGWRSFRPGFLQKLVNPKWFILFLSIFSFTQGLLVNGFTSASLPDIEKEFGFSSKESGFILASNDISAIILVPFVSFFGSHGNKPRWIGYGSLITGIGALVFSLPKAMIGKYIPANINPDVFNRDGLCHIANTTMTPPCMLRPGGSSSVNLMVFSIGQLLMGAGTTPLYTLGVAYLDENVNPKQSPIYLGVWFASTFLGPGLGYVIGGLFLGQFTNIELPKGMNLTPKDPRWIGAWWLGYFTLSWSLLIGGLCMLGFPREMPKFKKKRIAAMKIGDLPTTDTTIGKGWRDLLRATIKLFKNVTYICVTLGLTVRLLFGVALVSFFAKVLTLKFGGSTAERGLATGAVIVPGSIIGILAGSFVMKKLNLRNSVKTATKLCFLLSIGRCFLAAIWLIPGCRDTDLAGVKVPYNNSQPIGSLLSQCNKNCGCPRANYLPTCGSDGKTYFSPCFAGCTGKIGRKEFENCTCIPLQQRKTNYTGNFDIATAVNATNATRNIIYSKMDAQENNASNNKFDATLRYQPLLGTAKFGRCDRGCKNLILFLVSMSLVICLSFLSATPQKMIVLRCVPENQRSYALGMQFFLMRTLSFIPGPVILGAIIDSQCVLWKEDDCGKRGNCLEYRVDKLSLIIMIFGVATALTSIIFYALAWYFYVPPPTQNEDDAKLANEKNGLIDGAAIKGKDEDGISVHSVPNGEATV